LIVRGSGFDIGAVIVVDGLVQKTKNDGSAPGSGLIANKAGKSVLRDRVVILTVRNSDGVSSEELSFYTGCF
jgi:hypothetical protein